jgi:hypothetical protein
VWQQEGGYGLFRSRSPLQNGTFWRTSDKLREQGYSEKSFIMTICHFFTWAKSNKLHTRFPSQMVSCVNIFRSLLLVGVRHFWYRKPKTWTPPGPGLLDHKWHHTGPGFWGVSNKWHRTGDFCPTNGERERESCGERSIVSGVMITDEPSTGTMFIMNRETRDKLKTYNWGSVRWETKN